MAALDDGGKGAEVFDAAVGAGSQEDVVNGFAHHAFSLLEAHIVEGLAVGLGDGGGYVGSDGNAHAGIGAVGNHGLNVGAVELEFFIKHGVVLALERFPISNGLVPLFALGSVGTALEILKGGFVGSYHAAACAHFDGEVAQGEAAFHGEVAHYFSGIFNEVSGGAAGRDFRHQIEGHVFGGDASAQAAVHGDAHGLGFLLQDALRGQDHFYFARADAEGYGAHGSVGGGVGVAAHDGHAGQGESFLRTYDVNDAVVLVHHAVVFQAELVGVFLQGVYLFARYGVFNRFVLVVGGCIVVGHAVDALGAEAFQAAGSQAGKGLRTGDFVTIEAVDK